MSLKDRAISEPGVRRVESLAVRIDRALASLGAAELNLRKLQLSRLPATADSLALAAADLESLRRLVPLPESHTRIEAALRPRMEKLGCASRRVCALYAAAKGFHAGLALAREREAAAYDALGTVHGLSGSRRSPHGLETQG